MAYLVGRVAAIRVFLRGVVRSRTTTTNAIVVARSEVGPHGVKLVSRCGINIDPSPVSRSYCRCLRSAPWCGSYRDLAETRSYNPPPFARAPPKKPR